MLISMLDFMLSCEKENGEMEEKNLGFCAQKYMQFFPEVFYYRRKLRAGVFARSNSKWEKVLRY